MKKRVKSTSINSDGKIDLFNVPDAKAKRLALGEFTIVKKGFGGICAQSVIKPLTT